MTESVCMAQSSTHGVGFKQSQESALHISGSKEKPTIISRFGSYCIRGISKSGTSTSNAKKKQNTITKRRKKRTIIII